MARVSKSQLVREWLMEDPGRMDVEGAAAKCCKKFKCTQGIFYAAKRVLNDRPMANPAEEECIFADNNMSRLKVDISAIEGMGLDRVKKILELLT